jgi:tetratricopeptide (TPR) repeat protein
MPALKLWTPRTIGVMSYLLGFPSGITLAALNWMRMGLRRKAVLHIIAGLIGLWLMAAFSDSFRTALVILINIGSGLYLGAAMRKDIEVVEAARIQYSHWASGLGVVIGGLAILLVVFYGLGFVEGLIPGTSLYHANRGDEYSNNGKYDLAIAEYTKAMKRQTNREQLAVLFYYRGYAYYNKGDLQNAISDFSSVLAIRPDEKRSYLMRGVGYATNGEYEPAVKDFTQVISMDPKGANAYYDRGLAYEKLGISDQAIQDFQKALELTHDPGLKTDAENELLKLKQNSLQ